MSLCHGWRCHPIQTASHIHIRHIQSVWAHWYAVHRHMVIALLSYTCPTCLRCWWSGWLVESKWCHYVMVGAAIVFKLRPMSILDIQSVWVHSYAVHRHMVVAFVSYTHPTWVKFWCSGSLVELKWCHYVMVEASFLIKLLPTSILDIYKVFAHIDMLSIGIW